MSFPLPDLATSLRWAGLHAALALQALAGPQGHVASRWRQRAERSGRTPLVLYSQVAWDDVWQRPQELATHLSRWRPVLFFSPVQVHQVAGPLSGRWRPLALRNGGRLLVASPMILTGEYRASLPRSLNARLAARYLKALLPARKSICMTNSPFPAWLPGVVKPSRMSMDLIDDFCAFDWAPPNARETEAGLLRRSDFALAGTQTLADGYRSRVPEIEYIPSGADVEKLTRPTPEPEELRGLPHPRLLYVGTLNDRLSGELLDATARAFPNASVILVGPRRATFKAPKFPTNVKELGLRPHDELPGFYQHCDVGMMPFADNEAARAINPIKTLEYLACGLPVISTPIPDVERFYSSVVRIARPAEWPAALRSLLAEDSAALQSERRAFADGRSWLATARRFEAVLRRWEAKKGRPR